MPSRQINTYDIDGVIYMGDKFEGLTPEPRDYIITGRSYEEYDYTIAMLQGRDIYNKVFFNPIAFDKKTRESSGEHKATIINGLLAIGVKIGLHFEDDEVQAEIIERLTPVKVVRIVHDLVEKENVWHGPIDNRSNEIN